MGNFMINNIPMQIVTATGTINAKASISPNRMEMKPDGTEIEDYVKVIVNEEIRTPENTDYFNGLINDELRTPENTLYLKSLMLEVLQEQGLIEIPN
jgi:hypothetical protein